MAYQFYINSLGKEQGGGCVAEVVDSEVGEVICFEEFLEAVVNIAWFAWAAIFVAEDKVIILVALAKEDAVFALPEFHAVQGVGDYGGDADGGGGCVGFYFIHYQGGFLSVENLVVGAACKDVVVFTAHAVPDVKDIGVQGHIFPFQGAHLSTAKAGQGTKADDKVVDGNAVFGCGVKKLLHFVDGGHFGGGRGGRWWIHGFAGIDCNQFPSDC